MKTNYTIPQCRKEIIKVYKNRCQYCCEVKLDGSLHIDHIVPKSQGGKDDILNYTLACKNCNLRKSGKNLLIAYRGLLLSIAESKKKQILKLIKLKNNNKKEIKKTRNCIYKI